MAFKGVDYYQIDDLLSDDEKMVRNLTREFMEKEVEPFIVKAWDQEEPINIRELAPKMGELGLLGARPGKRKGPIGISPLIRIKLIPLRTVLKNISRHLKRQ